MSEQTLAQEILRHALALDPSARAAYLAEACASDEGLRRAVEVLLRGQGVVEATLLTPASLAPEREGPGSRIGPYKLLQQVGEGGFGVVFMADQIEPVRRRVALKVLKLGMDTRRVVARFEAERQALALMDHPHIARVLDAGATQSGRPYFVMELVKGDPITTYADREKLSIQERLELYLQVCQAVQHAHQKGIIHRDLKPSNVLVATQDGRPHAKVIDFGIAKATDQQLTDKTLFTELHALIGTPAYMSPEQAEGSLDIDTRSDVYSLGVLLYELLAGSPPFDPAHLRSSAHHELLRIIREVEPPRPSTRLTSRESASMADASPTTSLERLALLRRTEPAKLGHLVRGELDWIVMMAMEKDRARRYGTASELAADLERHLAGEPVRAAPPSAVYRLRKLVHRHRGRVIAAAAMVFILLASTAVATAAWRRASLDRERAEAAQLEAESERSVAVDERQRADVERDAALSARELAESARETAELQRRRAELQERADRQLTDFVTGLLSLGELHSEVRPDMTVRELLDHASAQLGRLEDNPLAEARLAATLGKAYLWLGPSSAADEHLGRAIGLFERSGVAREDELIELTMSRYWAAASASSEGYYEIALRAWSLVTASLGRHDPELGQRLASFELEVRRELGLERGFARTLESAEWILARCAARFSAGDPERRHLADFLQIAGDWISWFVDDPAASRMYEHALAIYAAELGPEDPRSLRCTMLLAGALTSSGEFERAEGFLGPRLEALRTMLGPEHELVELLEFRLLECAAARGEAEALRELDRRLALLEARHGRHSTYWRRNCGHLARAHERVGAREEAESLRLALAEVVLEMPSDPRYLAFTLEGLETGRVCVELQRIGQRRSVGSIDVAEANQAVLETLSALAEAIERELEPEDPRRVLVSRSLIVLADEWEQSWGESLMLTRLAELSLELLAPFGERVPFDASRALTTLVRHRELAPGGDLELAERMTKEAIALRLRPGTPEWFAGSAESLLGDVLIRRGRYEEARGVLASACERLLRMLGAENSNTRVALARMVRACRGAAEGPATKGHVHALGRILFATLLGVERATADRELLDLWARLEIEQDEARAMSLLLDALRDRAELAQADPARLAGLAQQWAWRYVDDGGAHEVATGLLEEVRALASSKVGAAALELDLMLLAADLCERARDWSGGERIVRLGLERASERGLEQGARAARLTSLLGRFATEQGRLAEAGVLLTSSYETLSVLEGPFAMSTLVALRRLVDGLAAAGDLDTGARLAADALEEILLRSDASAWLLDELAFYVFAAPELDTDLRHRALTASRRAVELDPREPKHHDTLALGLLRTGHPDEALASLARATDLTDPSAPPRATNASISALLHRHLGDPATAEPALHRALELAESEPALTHTDRRLLDEARTSLKVR